MAYAEDLGLVGGTGDGPTNKRAELCHFFAKLNLQVLYRFVERLTTNCLETKR